MKTLSGQTLRKLIRGANSLLARSNHAILRTTAAYITGHGHFSNLVIVGVLQGDNFCRFLGQAPVSAKNIQLDCEPLGISRRV